MEGLDEQVIRRFRRITGLNIRVLETGQPAEPHPDCAAYRNSNYCHRVFEAHLKETQARPQTHWLRCKHAMYCAFVPLVWRGQCLASCQVVCSDFIGQHEFERCIELLDVLVENFVSRAQHLLTSSAGESCAESLQDARLGKNPLHPRIITALEYIRRHITDPDLTVSRMARVLDINSTYLAHLFAQQMGVRLSRYICSCRIDIAKKLLKETNWQVKRIALESGHSNPCWFSEVFHMNTGMTPTQFRLQARNGSA